MTGKSAGGSSALDSVGLFQTHLAALDAEGREHAEEVEREAFDEMISQIDQEKDTETKEFMMNTLKGFCEEGVCLSVRYETSWDQLTKKRRDHQRLVEPVDLFLVLESIIAEQTDSSRYTMGARQLRYPLTIPGNGSEESRSVRNFNAREPKASLYESYYKFGSHHLYVGHAVAEILRHLEKRYGLDFKKLEISRQHPK